MSAPWHAFVITGMADVPRMPLNVRRGQSLRAIHRATLGQARQGLVPALSMVACGLSRFAVMQHLGVLTSAGVVIAERRGRDRINPVPLREWYERWVQPLADTGSAELLALKRQAETGERSMPGAIEPIRTVRLAFELRTEASAERTFEVMTQQAHRWFPHNFEEPGAVVVRVTKVAVGPLTEEEAAGIGEYGDLSGYTPAITKLAAG